MENYTGITIEINPKDFTLRIGAKLKYNMLIYDCL
jgi:hypothetical protein